jgi:hypothetical protein
MKTAVLRDENFETLVEAMSECIAGCEMSIDFLTSRFGPHSEQVKQETARLKRLTDADEELRLGPGAWRARGTSLTSH